MIDLFWFVTSWDDPSITPNTIRLFAKNVPVMTSLESYTDALVTRFINDGTLYLMGLSCDSQRGSSSIGKYLPASVESKLTLNKKLREPEKLILYKHDLYECTINDPQGRYNQSSLALLLELPLRQTVESFQSIFMWIAPAGTTDLDFASFRGQPTSDQLIDLEWVQVKIGCAPEQIVVLRGGAHAKRMQYALKHRGALTINRAQGSQFTRLLLKYPQILPLGNPAKSLLPCQELDALVTPS